MVAADLQSQPRVRRFQMECAGKISPVGNMAIIGAGASGLLCSHTQTR